MSQHNDAVYVGHMLDAARKALEFSSGKTRADLDTDEMRALAIDRLIHIIGEAARRMSQAYRTSHPEIPWREIIGTRDRLIHGYDDVNHDIVWTILTMELPPLIAKLKRLAK